MKNTFISAILLILSAAVTADAQSPAKNIPDTAANRLAGKLSVSKEKAAKIQAAYSYHHDDMERLMKDNKLNPTQKQQQLKRLLAQRRHQIDSLVTPPQKDILQRDRSLDAVNEQNRRLAIEKNHEQELSKVPHKRVLRDRPKTDSTQTKVKPKKP